MTRQSLLICGRLRRCSGQKAKKPAQRQAWEKKSGKCRINQRSTPANSVAWGQTVAPARRSPPAVGTGIADCTDIWSCRESDSCASRRAPSGQTPAPSLRPHSQYGMTVRQTEISVRGTKSQASDLSGKSTAAGENHEIARFEFSHAALPSLLLPMALLDTGSAASLLQGCPKSLRVKGLHPQSKRRLPASCWPTASSAAASATTGRPSTMAFIPKVIAPSTRGSWR